MNTESANNLMQRSDYTKTIIVVWLFISIDLDVKKCLPEFLSRFRTFSHLEKEHEFLLLRALFGQILKILNLSDSNFQHKKLRE